MAYFNISGLPLATALTGSEQLVGDQFGVTVAISVAQIAAIALQGAGGANTEVLYNGNGLQTGSPGFTFNAGTSTLSVPNATLSGALTAGSVSATTITVGSAFTAPAFIATEPVAGSLTNGAYSYGNMQYADTGNLATFAITANEYAQIQVQNYSTGTGASADIIVANSATTATAGYGDFGINGVSFTGVGSLGAADMVYLYAANVDLTIGTSTANVLHFVTNGSATDAGSISAAGNWLLGAPTSGATETVNAISGGMAIQTTGDVQVSQQAAATGANFYLIGGPTGITTSRIRYNSNGAGHNRFALRDDFAAVDRITVLDTGAVSIAAPGSSVSTLSVAGAVTTNPIFQVTAADSASVAIKLLDGGVNASGIQAFTNNANAFIGTIGTAAVPLILQTAGASRIQINGAGAITASAPTAGNTFTASTLSGQAGIVSAAAAATPAYVSIAGNGAVPLTGSFDLIQDATGNARVFNRAATNLDFSTSGTQRVNISAIGNVLVNTPSSGTNPALQASAIAGGTSGYFVSPATAGQSFGVQVDAGTNASDTALLVRTAVGANIFKINGAGATTLAAAAAGVTLAISGTVNGANIVNVTDGTITISAYTTTGQALFGTTTNHSFGLTANNVARLVISTSGDIAARGVALCKFKTADGTSATTTVAADPDLQVALAAATTYDIEVYLQFGGDATAITHGLNAALYYNAAFAGLSSMYSWVGCLNGSSAAATRGVANSITTAASIANVVTSGSIVLGTTDFILMKGRITTTAAGTLGVNWAQNSTGTGNLTIYRTSYMKVTQLS